MTGAGMMLVGLTVDLLIGWPNWLFARVGHPVTWIGGLIGRLDLWLNLDGTEDRDRRLAGVVGALLVISAAAAVAALVQWLLPPGWRGLLIGGLIAWPLIAARSLHDHVRAVAAPLIAGDIAAARLAVARIVGRDPAALDAAGVSRASIESLAENASDGVIAPLFWGAIFGLPGIAAYKAINTLDSMIGHRTPRHQAFGWAAARIDDLVNLIPARLTGLLIALVAPAPRAALAVMWRDAPRHRSPNAGWPEAAMAAALSVRLSGPRTYQGHTADEPWVNPGAADPAPADIERALSLSRRALAVAAAVLAVVWLI